MKQKEKYFCENSTTKKLLKKFSEKRKEKREVVRRNS